MYTCKSIIKCTHVLKNKSRRVGNLAELVFVIGTTVLKQYIYVRTSSVLKCASISNLKKRYNKN